jgi:glycosyltransferase involved in cell wall biosynthesis
VRFARSGPPSLPADPPLVSVIIPTYNWSSVLRHAIRSVLGQTWPNLELLVVGDGCTDDSQDVVASFRDPRVRWINLPENAGTQSAPNNAGLDLAAGRYVAYLGHDDLWHPWHLAAVVGDLELSGARFGHGLVELVGPPRSRLKVLGGMTPVDEEGRWVPPTTMVHRTEDGRRLRWRHYTEAEHPTDVDFAERLRGAVGPPRRVLALTSFKFVATWRPNCYRDRRDDEQAAWSRRIETEPRLLERELASLLLHRLSPVHGRIPRPPERPEDAPIGWLTMHARRVRGLEDRVP